MRAFALSRLFDFSASSDDDEKQLCNLRSFRRRRRNDRGRQAMLPIYSELIGLSVFVSRISGRYKKKEEGARGLRSRGSSGSRYRAMMMKKFDPDLRSFRRRRRNDRGRL